MGASEAKISELEKKITELEKVVSGSLNLYSKYPFLKGRDFIHKSEILKVLEKEKESYTPYIFEQLDGKGFRNGNSKKYKSLTYRAYDVAKAFDALIKKENAPKNVNRRQKATS